MKKLTVIFALILFYGCLFAQECNYLQNKIDDFTNKKVISTGLKLSAFSKMWINYNGGEYTLWIYYTNQGTLNLNVRMNDTISFKFGDGAIISLYPKEERLQQKAQIGYVITQYIDPTYKLTKEQLDKFAHSRVNKIRILFEGKQVNIDLNEGKSKNFWQAANCLITAPK